MPVDRTHLSTHPLSANGARTSGFSLSWKRQAFNIKPFAGGNHTDVPRHPKFRRDDPGASKGKAPHRTVRIGDHHLPPTSNPGTPAWIVDLVFSALNEEKDLYILQRAIQALVALESGSARWRDVNIILANRTPGSVAAAATALAEREEEIQGRLDGMTSNCVSYEFDVFARNFAHEDLHGGVYSGCTYFVKPPSDWKPIDLNGRPPDIDRAPTHCLFLMPKRPYDPEDPWRVWILDENRRWSLIEQYTAHPDPKFHPRILRLQPNDKTPNWVLPDSVRRKPGRKAPIPQAEPQRDAPTVPPSTSTQGPSTSTRSRTQKEQSPNATAGPSRPSSGPSWSRSARNEGSAAL